MASVLVSSRSPGDGAAIAAELAALGHDVVTTASATPALCIALGDVPVASLPSCPCIFAMSGVALPRAVELLRADPRVIAVAEAEPPRRIASLADRALRDGPAGARAVLAAGAQLHEHVVRDAGDKARCLRGIGELVQQLGAARTRAQAIEQCVDELVMNALYGAPVDAAGAHVFANVSARQRVTMRTRESVHVQYAHVGTTLAVAVRDAFGSLGRDAVIGYLYKGLHATEAVDRRVGGAGLGLYLLVTAASAATFDVVPGISTEVTCVFQLADGKHALEELAFLPHDPAGRPRTRPARVRLSTRARARRAGIGLVAAAAVAGAAAGVYRVALRPTTAHVTIATTPGATIELEGRPVGVAADGTLALSDLEIGYPYRVSARLDGYAVRRTVARLARGGNDLELSLDPVATLELDSRPADAIVEIDGQVTCSTPCAVTTLAPGATATAVFRLAGHRPTTQRVQAPARGQRQKLVATLEVDATMVRVHVTSVPPGAAILREGDRLENGRVFTPGDVYVEAEHEVQLTLAMPGHVSVKLPAFTPQRGVRDIEQTAELVKEPVR